MKYTDAQRAAKISETAEKLIVYLRENHVSQEDVLQCESLRWTITTPLYNIGEHVYHLSDRFKDAHPGVPWAKISGLRHRLVHDYDNTNWSLICSVIFDILPGFLEEMKKIIE